MDQTEYKTICEQPDVLARRTLEHTLRELELAQRHTLSRQLQSILREQPIAKPHHHSGDPESDHFKVTFSVRDVDEIVGVLGEAESGAACGDDESSSGEAGRLANLLDAWLPLLHSLR